MKPLAEINAKKLTSATQVNKLSPRITKIIGAIFVITGGLLVRFGSLGKLEIFVGGILIILGIGLFVYSDSKDRLSG